MRIVINALRIPQAGQVASCRPCALPWAPVPCWPQWVRSLALAVLGTEYRLAAADSTERLSKWITLWQFEIDLESLARHGACCKLLSANQSHKPKRELVRPDHPPASSSMPTIPTPFPNMSNKLSQHNPRDPRPANWRTLIYMYGKVNMRCACGSTLIFLVVTKKKRKGYTIPQFISIHCSSCWCHSKDGERTLIGEDNYSKIFLMKMPIMVRTCSFMMKLGSCQLCQSSCRTEYCWLKNANDRILLALGSFGHWLLQVSSIQKVRLRCPHWIWWMRGPLL